MAIEIIVGILAFVGAIAIVALFAILYVLAFDEQLKENEIYEEEE